MNKTIGFIGSGNMAQAMISSIIDSKLVPREQIIASEIFAPIREMVEKKFKILTTIDNIEVAKKADFIILAVKPNVYELILSEIKDHVKEEAIVIGIGAGISLPYLKSHLNPDTKVIRAMPNTPAMVGAGMTALSISDDYNEKQMQEILSIFNSFGKTEVVEEYLMDGVTAVSGSAPAYVFVMIEAMADAAVLEGIPRAQAYTMAAQAVMGSAKMVLETGMHPGQLKDMVCSPGGTTIEAVASLEKTGFRSSIIEAMRICAKKSKIMGK
ncbi:MAG: pyrroline-5-carboxylate reductase [Tissierellia bacterium]|jgi:pyrroline-5-carboxylate reductase|nr:pyrroline-5-carboxylate reductase [Tissierellia bacterium]